MKTGVSLSPLLCQLSVSRGETWETVSQSLSQIQIKVLDFVQQSSDHNAVNVDLINLITELRSLFGYKKKIITFIFRNI